MRSLVLLIIATLYGSVNYYLSGRVILLLNTFLPFNSTLIVRGVFLGLTASTLASLLLSSLNVSSFIGKLGSYWFGISLLSLFIFGVMDLIRFSVKKIAHVDITVAGLLTAVLLIVFIFSYGVWQANQLKVTKYQVNIAKKSQLSGLKAVMLSDLHLGYVNGAEKLEKIVKTINQIEPDIVMISGDLFDGNFEAVQHPQKVQQLLSSIQAEYGTYLVWGNHDAGENFDKMSAFIKESKLILLEDNLIEVANKFALMGRKDSSPIGNQNGARKAVTGVTEQIAQLPLIVLDHQPSNWKEYGSPVDLVLSGHTHQGQVFPFNLATKKIFDVDYGQGHNEEGTQIIVSSGAGTWGPPIRIGTKTEIVQIEMTFNN